MGKKEQSYKLFISHANADKEIIGHFIDLLYALGLSEENIFYSSTSELGVPLGEDIYDYLRGLLDSEKIIPLFMLSENYYNSAACLNEMGAVWIKQYKYYTILLPGFRFEKMKGAVDPRKLSVDLGADEDTVRGGLITLKNVLCELFDIKFSQNREIHWNRCLTDFLNQISKMDSTIDVDLNENAGFCIGHFDVDAVTVRKDDTLKKVRAEFDFSKTKADLCSLVFYLNCVNLRNKVKNHRKWKFWLKTSKNIKMIIAEIQIGTESASKSVQQPIYPEEGWNQYVIDLAKLGGHLNKWECSRQCNFLLHRTKIDGDIETIEVKDIKFD